jgi:hypothetical protein
MNIGKLYVPGYQNEDVANTFFRQEHETRHLAILFPGLGYTAHMPVIYYPGCLLTTRGADVLRVEHSYQAWSGKERIRCLNFNASSALDTALAQRKYEQVTLVGKSLGTYAVGHLLTTHAGLPQLQCIWLTPLLSDPELRSQIKKVKHRALFVIGTADPEYNAAQLAEVQQATGGESILIDGANHSLEIGGDVVQSIRAMQQVIECIQRFLG